MNRIAVIIVNYNMPEAVDDMCDHIIRNTKSKYDLIVVDNGSDLVKPSKYSTILLPENIQTCGGWLAGLDIADLFERYYGFEYFAYLICITSTTLLEERDYISEMKSFLVQNNDAVGIMPSLELESGIDVWHHMENGGMDQPRQVMGLDSAFTMWRADWFNSIGRFDPDFYYAWGTGEETSYKARKQNRTMWVHDGMIVRKTQDVGYKMNRMNMSGKDRRKKAMKNVIEIMTRKYGPNWSQVMNLQYLTKEMQ